ncbi:MAG: hypothetical protein H2069_06610 [Legionella sp.]|nr:hypothetical protein [Legionella sp.]
MDNKYIYLRTGEYLFIPTVQSDDYNGVFTDNLCECVFIYIVSDKGYAAAHFYRKNDANDLIEKIERDFQGAKRLDVMLVGGFFNRLAFPWKIEKRELKFADKKYWHKVTLDKIHRVENAIHALNQEDNSMILIENYHQNFIGQSFLKAKNCDVANNGLFTVDLDSFNQTIKNKNLIAKSLSGSISFQVKNIKDFLGYQNVIKLVDKFQIIAHNLPCKFRLRHYFCDVNSTIKTFFSPYSIEKNVYASSAGSADLALIKAPKLTQTIQNSSQYYPISFLAKTKTILSDLNKKEQEKQMTLIASLPSKLNVFIPTEPSQKQQGRADFRAF